MRELEARVRAAAATIPSLRRRVILACSGGADSSALAALLLESGAVDPGRAQVAHFDHRLRDEAGAAADRAAVDALCARYGLELVTGSWERPRSGEHHARDARYAFLRGVAEDGRACVVTGHTADDQAETVLMRMLRGAGVHGLAAMRPDTSVHGLRIARPLLGVRRVETRAYCVSRGLRFEDDPTNGDMSRARNRIRLGLLAELESALPDAHTCLTRIAQAAAGAADELDAAAARSIVRSSDDEAVLSRRMLRGAHPMIAAAAFRLAIERVTGTVQGVGRGHLGALVRGVQGRTGATYELPQGLIACVDADEVVVMRAGMSRDGIDPALRQTLPYEGRAGGWLVRAIPSEDGDVWLPKDAVLRARMPGDRMALPGGTRKLQDVLVDAKVPARKRDSVPVIAVGSDVLWLPFRTSAPRGDYSRWDVAAVPTGGGTIGAAARGA